MRKSMLKSHIGASLGCAKLAVSTILTVRVHSFCFGRSLSISHTLRHLALVEPPDFAGSGHVMFEYCCCSHEAHPGTFAHDSYSLYEVVVGVQLCDVGSAFFFGSSRVSCEVFSSACFIPAK